MKFPHPELASKYRLSQSLSDIPGAVPRSMGSRVDLAPQSRSIY
ncbi:hypothetical protein [Shewanella surugensis]|nr:hypothetical protein [Shewanella surugensis]